jgi:hypothetical protein
MIATENKIDRMVGRTDISGEELFLSLRQYCTNEHLSSETTSAEGATQILRTNQIEPETLQKIGEFARQHQLADEEEGREECGLRGIACFECAKRWRELADLAFELAKGEALRVPEALVASLGPLHERLAADPNGPETGEIYEKLTETLAEIQRRLAA